MKLHTVLAGNIELLEQADGVLRQLPAGAYVAAHPGVCATGIGGMVRHLLDFYGCFLAGYEDGRVDYDARRRDLALEREVPVARDRIREVIAELQRLSSADGGRPLLVRAEDVGPGESQWAPSSIGRELTFLLSHTVHHHALIAAMLHRAGVQAPDGFGVALSTLAHEQSRRASAN